MTKSEYMTALIQLLSLVQSEHDFKAGPLSPETLVHLSAFKNDGLKMGFPTISGYLSKVLDARADAMAQQIYLFNGLSKDSGLVDRDTKPLLTVASDRYTAMGGDFEALQAEVMGQVTPEDGELEDALTDTIYGGDKEIDMGDLETDDTAQSLGDLGISSRDEETSAPEPEEEEAAAPDEEEEVEPEVAQKEKPGDEEDRVAQEGDDEELEDGDYADPEPEPLNDGKLFEWADLTGSAERILAYTDLRFALTEKGGKYFYQDSNEGPVRVSRSVAISTYRRAHNKLVKESFIV